MKGTPATLRRMRRSCRNFRFTGGSGTAAPIAFGHLPQREANKKKKFPQPATACGVCYNTKFVEQLRILGSAASSAGGGANPARLAVLRAVKIYPPEYCMNMKKMSVNRLVRCAVIAAVYVVVCLALAPFSYGAVQVRAG